MPWYVDPWWYLPVGSSMMAAAVIAFLLWRRTRASLSWALLLLPILWFFGGRHLIIPLAGPILAGGFLYLLWRAVVVLERFVDLREQEHRGP